MEESTNVVLRAIYALQFEGRPSTVTGQRRCFDPVPMVMLQAELFGGGIDVGRECGLLCLLGAVERLLIPSGTLAEYTRPDGRVVNVYFSESDPFTYYTATLDNEVVRAQDAYRDPRCLDGVADGSRYRIESFSITRIGFELLRAGEIIALNLGSTPGLSSTTNQRCLVLLDRLLQSSLRRSDIAGPQGLPEFWLNMDEIQQVVCELRDLRMSGSAAALGQAADRAYGATASLRGALATGEPRDHLEDLVAAEEDHRIGLSNMLVEIRLLVAGLAAEPPGRAGTNGETGHKDDAKSKAEGDVWLGHSEIARRNGLDPEPVRKMLGRLRKKNHDCYKELEASERKPREPKYLYNLREVQPYVDKMKAVRRRVRRTSGQKTPPLEKP